MADHKYRVVRQHIGDKPYVPGDERIAQPAEVAHLVPNILEDLGPVKAKADEKAETAPQNKAERKPANKSET